MNKLPKRWSAKFFVATLAVFALMLGACAPAGTGGTDAGTGSDTPTVEATVAPGGSDVMTDTETMTDTDMMTDTGMMTDTDMMTDTGMMTDTDMMTDTESMTDTGMMTDTDMMTATETVTN